MGERQIPIIKPGGLSSADLSSEEKRWFLIVLRVLQDDGLAKGDAYELLSKAFYISDHNRSASLRDIVNALHETSRAIGRPVWKEDSLIRLMGANIGIGLNPDEALSKAQRDSALIE